MKIEVGKFYRTRDGRKVGPMEETDNGDPGGFRVDRLGLYRKDGTFGFGSACYCRELDIIAEWVDEQTGTLAELDVKPGDVVECVVAAYNNFTIGKEYKINDISCIIDNFGNMSAHTISKFRIISRASDAPMRCAECDSEKGGDDCNWIASYTDETFFGLSANRFTTEELQHIAEHVAAELSKRIKPEPVRETVTCWWGAWGFTLGNQSCRDTHRITFTTTDGKPDLDNIKMEALG